MTKDNYNHEAFTKKMFCKNTLTECSPVSLPAYNNSYRYSLDKILPIASLGISAQFTHTLVNKQTKTVSAQRFWSNVTGNVVQALNEKNCTLQFAYLIVQMPK